MTEASGKKRDLHSYQSGDTVRLPVEIRDETGVGHIFASYVRLDDPVTPGSWDFQSQVSLRGYGEEKISGEIILSGRVGNQKPGVYTMYQLEVRDTLDNRQIKNDVKEAPRFHLERGAGDAEPPEITR